MTAFSQKIYKTEIASNLSVIPAGFSEAVGSVLVSSIKSIISEINPLKIILFGSYAYGTPTPDSDVDLLVVMETALPPTERYLEVSRLLRPRPFPVDILVKTPDEIQAALDTGDFLIQEILDQGYILYERDQ